MRSLTARGHHSVHRGLAREAAGLPPQDAGAGYFVVRILLCEREFRRRLGWGWRDLLWGPKLRLATNASIGRIIRRAHGNLRGPFRRHGQRDRQPGPVIRYGDVVRFVLLRLWRREYP